MARRVADHPGAESVQAAASPLIADLPRPGGQTAPTSISPRLQTGAQPSARDHTVDARTLIVGEGISLAGQITSCDRLVVEGKVEANLQKCQTTIIAETGLFNGDAAIDDADVRGRFEGDLAVRKRLLIRASGRVAGAITYREIEIEAGGKISGTIQAS